MQIKYFSNTQINMSNPQTSNAGAKPAENPPPRPSHKDAVFKLGTSLIEEEQREILSGIEAIHGGRRGLL